MRATASPAIGALLMRARSKNLRRPCALCGDRHKAHLRRQFYEVYVGGNAPIATEALARIKLLYDIEAEVRGSPPEVRRALRQQRSRPVVEALKPWFEDNLARMSKGSKLAEAIAYGLNHWDGLCRFLDDGRIEIDSNTVERSIRGLALTRKNALFAGHDRGAAGWAMIASLLETCKLNAVDPLAWTTDVLTKLVNRWPASRIHELMPYAASRIMPRRCSLLHQVCNASAACRHNQSASRNASSLSSGR